MSHQNPRLLIVEEETTLAEVTAFRLELLGFEVHCASSPEAAQALLKQQTPDLLIINLKLPGMGGFAFLDFLAGDKATADIPRLALSFDADLDQVQKAFQAGVHDYLVAPYDPVVLETKVTRLLDERRAAGAQESTEKNRLVKA